jgi:hypothetical protein
MYKICDWVFSLSSHVQQRLDRTGTASATVSMATVDCWKLDSGLPETGQWVAGDWKRAAGNWAVDCWKLKGRVAGNWTVSCWRLDSELLETGQLTAGDWKRAA